MNANFSTRPGRRQSGYALILMVIGLLGIGGLVASGFTDQARVKAEQERYKHNQRVLREAKQALLQYAYDYPVIAGRGPGRLPCPDMDNNGNPDPVFFCGGANGNVGRLPWNTDDLKFYDARDATGERLWYAVSRNFANSDDGTLAVNSASLGTITVQDRSGAILHDGSATTGVVAVIIAPGDPLERGGVLQDRAADENDPANYLDLLGAVDNADFTNDGADGFVTGPVRDVVTGDLLVNDQIIVITAAEVIEMAEKATLQAYRAAIEDFLATTGDVYPWLFNYDDTDVNGLEFAELSERFPALNDFLTERSNFLLTNYGRIPSIFGAYFGPDTTQKFDGRLRGVFEYDFNTLNNGSGPGTVTSSGHGTFTFNSDLLTNSFVDAFLTVDIGFDDIDGDLGGDTRFTATLQSPIFINREIYFSEDYAAPAGFNICPDGGDALSDCHRDAAGNPQPGGAHQYDLRILRVQLEIEIPVNAPGPTIEIETDSTVNPTNISYPSTPGSVTHARIEADYDLANVLPGSNMPTMMTVIADYDYDSQYLVGDTISYGSGTLDVSDLLLNSNLTVNIRYYPELPAWAFDNGWHNSIRMAYAPNYRPDGVAGSNCTPGLDCLRLVDSPGSPQDKQSILVLAAQHDWVDDSDPGLHDDLADVFDATNADDPDTADDNFALHEGNDRILVIR